MDHFDDTFEWKEFDGDIYPGSEEEYQLSLWDRSRPTYPSMYEVVLIDNGYTPEDFVIALLQELFRKSVEKSARIVLEMQRKGRAVCEVCTKEVAEMKVSEVNMLASSNYHPLTCVIQKGSNYVVKKS